MVIPDVTVIFKYSRDHFFDSLFITLAFDYKM